MGVEGVAVPVVCPKCGFLSQPGSRYCGNCGTPIVQATVAPMGPPTPPSPTLPYDAYPQSLGSLPSAAGPPSLEELRRTEIDRTRVGVLLLLGGTLVTWIPLVGGVGLGLSVIGAILVVLGRGPFGSVHSRNVIVSVLLIVLGITVAFIGAIVIVLAALVSIPPGGGQAGVTAAFEAAIVNLLGIGVAAAIVTNLSYVLLTYDLQNHEGRLLLWAAYGAALGLQAAIIVLMIPLLPGLADEFAKRLIAGGSVDWVAILNVISGQTNGLGLFGVIPAALFGVADFLAWRRIHRGEVPTIAPRPGPTLGIPGTAPVAREDPR